MKVAVRTLNQVLLEHAEPWIDFLKIDVEGFERAVLEGIDLAHWRPRIILLEATLPETWEPLLFGAGYVFAAYDGVNRFYARAEEPELADRLRVPVSVLDNWISAEHLRLIERVASGAPDLGPNTIALARRLQALSRRYPRLSAFAKKLLRMAG
jgi:hypothetical protein